MSNGTPDLASVLQALASYGQQQQQTQQIPQRQYPGQTQYTQQAGSYRATNDVRPNGGSHSSQPQSHSRVKQAYEPTSPAIDPSTITEWPLGLRCVAQVSSQNPNFKPAVRKLIHDQRLHEQLWSKGLEGLLQKQQQQQPGALLSLGDADPAQLAAINSDAGIKAYVSKVYSASAEMHKAMIAELKSLGVPFFGTHPDCIDRRLGGSGGGDEQQAGKEAATSRISEGQLLALRRKMVQYLEDMYG